MGLFDRKYCDFCGEKIGLLGNRKLQDGNMCKKCAAKLSPWFSERRESTKAEIQEQMNYREENRQAVAEFHTTRSIGKYTKLLMDEDARKFMVTSARDLAEANPDVLDYSQVTGCDLDIQESRSEQKTKDKEGKSVSYNPPRYDYSYDFYVNIDVNHPYFNRMRMKVNSSAVWLRYNDVNRRRQGAVMNGLMGASQMQGADVYTPEYQEQMFIAQDIRDSLMQTIMTAQELEKENSGKPVMVGFDRKVRIDRAFLDELASYDVFEHEYFDAADDILIIQGTKDEIIPFDLVKQFAEQNVIELIVAENADHRFSDPKIMDLAVANTIHFLWGS